MTKIRTTVSQDRAFLDEITNPSALETAIDFIESNFTAEEVYGRDVMEEWAIDNGFIPESLLEDAEEKIESLQNNISSLESELEQKGDY